MTSNSLVSSVDCVYDGTRHCAFLPVTQSYVSKVQPLIYHSLCTHFPLGKWVPAGVCSSVLLSVVLPPTCSCRSAGSRVRTFLLLI